MTPRDRLLTAWTRLAREGAHVRRVSIGRLTPSERGALAEHEEARLRAIAEGRAAGWHPRPAT